MRVKVTSSWPGLSSIYHNIFWVSCEKIRRAYICTTYLEGISLQEFLDKLGCAFVVGLFILDLFLQLVRKIRVDCSCKWVSDFINSCKNKRARYLLVPLLINRADSMANGRAMGTKRGATRGAAAAATVLRKTGRLNARIEVRSKWFIVESAKKQ